LEGLIRFNCKLAKKTYTQLTGINYAGKNWYVSKGDLVTPENFYSCWPAHSTLNPKELVSVTSNLSRLEIELNEGRRFIAGLILFPAPIEKFNEVLDDILFLPVKEEFQKLVSFHSEDEWTPLAEKVMDEYVKANEHAVKAMSQRVLINMISSQAIRK
jgi:hypothetical protein